MNDVNRSILIGNLVRDAEVSYLQTGSAIAKFSIAVNRSKKQGDQWVDEASFFDIVLYGKLAESLKQYLTKGKKVGIDGYLKQDRWKDKNDGSNRSKVYVVAEAIELLGGNGGGQARSGNGAMSANGGGFTEDIPYDSGETFSSSEEVPF